MKPLKQLIPSEVCLKCEVCCRFLTPESDMFPVFMKEEVKRLSPDRKSLFEPSSDDPSRVPTPLRPAATSYHGSGSQACACPFFNPVTQECAIYLNRPLDCQLYPFVLTLSPTRKRVFLSLDTQCPFVQDLTNQEALFGYGAYVQEYLEKKEVVDAVAGTSGFIRGSGETVLPLYPLAGLTEKLFQTTLFGNPPLPSAGLFLLTLKDREAVEYFFSASPREFAEEAFPPLVAFSDLLRFYWKRELDVLFIVAEQGNNFFMPIPPITKKQTPQTLDAGFTLLATLNKQGNDLRIEGLPFEACVLATELGCTVYPKSPEYLYRRSDLAALAGDAYKSKRSLCNYFAKNYHFTYEPYRSRDFFGCFHLFKQWQERRFLSEPTDAYEQALLEDATFVHKRVLLHARALGMEGRVVRIAGEIKGYTFGYALNDETWCILVEIADQKVKGLAQFLFREFCREKKEFNWVSAMDDSGLERLQRVKESYRPLCKKIPYVAVRKGP